jgi:hypothetical protein
MDRFCWRKRMIMLNLLAEALGEAGLEFGEEAEGGG